MAKAEALGQTRMKGVAGEVARKILREHPTSTVLSKVFEQHRLVPGFGVPGMAGCVVAAAEIAAGT
ncbi:MAG: hypothetical protein ACXIUM_11360 [Wenzhouxiangella sp.]